MNEKVKKREYKNTYTLHASKNEETERENKNKLNRRMNIHKSVEEKKKIINIQISTM